MQRGWDILATRCQQPEDGSRFEACRESEMEGRTGEDQTQEEAQIEEQGRGSDEGPLHPEVEGMVVEAFMATTGEEAWLILRRAARMSRAQWAETLGTVACEVKERWGHIANYIQTNEDIKAVCEQEGVEVEQEEGGNHNWGNPRKIAGERPLTYLNIIAHRYRDRYQELVERNAEEQTRGGDESDEPRGRCQEAPTPPADVQGEEPQREYREEERLIDEEADAEPFHAFPEPPIWHEEEQEPQRDEEEEERPQMELHGREVQKKRKRKEGLGGVQGGH